MNDRLLIRTIEEAAFGAWPSLAQLLDDGWVLRFADGHTKRANSVNPTYPSYGDVDVKIARAEGWFRDRGLPAIFRVTPLAEPTDLDARLAARGYESFETSRALHNPALRAVVPTDLPASMTLRIDPRPDQGWLDAYLALTPLDAGKTLALRRMLDLIVPTARFGWLHEAGRPLAAAFVVVQGGLMGTYDVVTAPEARRRGLMRALLGQLNNAAIEAGAVSAAIFVVATNEPAGALYEGLGYRELYRYHYRMVPAR
ncbi:MAG TPA: GNAT family N-acetyltransferase [Aliidongia sp.]|uniref:GNAT family N-acetyltransferase n=1 Tax=Aliidongia sp. TaxID=1914230 RepID=UPI002DDD4DD0|nr:GNAT family N-acetyltransferase [Aliidongia sp.]HEV2674014.1 GNAT family N-acetyltransferase [Aliidongia sp.]